MARPMPLVDPVTITTFPVRSNRSVVGRTGISWVGAGTLAVTRYCSLEVTVPAAVRERVGAVSEGDP